MPPPVDELRQIIYVLVALLAIAVGLAIVHPACPDTGCTHAHRVHVDLAAGKASDARRKRATARHQFHLSNLPDRDCERCIPIPPP